MQRVSDRVSKWVCVLASLVFACLGSTLGGCASAPVQTGRPFTTGGAGSAGAYAPAQRSDLPDPIRIYSIQRLANGEGDSLTAVVSIRNLGVEQRKVTIAVAWLSQGGPTDGADAESRETVTLGPKESRDVKFEGAQGAHDFKVNLTYPGS